MEAVGERAAMDARWPKRSSDSSVSSQRVASSSLERKEIGADLGISTFVVGAVLVSFGTSLLSWRQQSSPAFVVTLNLGIGTALGSNIFNTSFIVGIAAMLAPIQARSSGADGHARSSERL